MAEPYLGNAKSTAEILRKYDFVFQKRFGQNFLIDPHVLEKIVRAAAVTKEDLVIEIGPGIGTLTQYLARDACEVLAVEIDKKLIPILQETLAPWDNVTVINEDILKMDLESVIWEKGEGKQVRIVANLPYYITTPIIMELLEKKLPIHSITVMIQKEVAERILAEPGTPEYGALSLAVQYYASAEIKANVPKNCFMPRPNVDSTVITLTRYEEPSVAVQNEGLLFSIIKASFNQRRKTLVNGIKNAAFLPFGREEVEKAIVECGLPLTVRGEALSLAQFAELSDALSRY